MMNKASATLLVASLALFSLHASARQWTLQECIDYALANNITIQKNRISKLSAVEDVKQSQAALLPTLSASTSQSVAYNPWPEQGSFTVQGSRVQTQVNKTYYNGSYGINANWTVWNGNQNRNKIALNKLTVEQAALDSAQTANTLQEQIAQLFVQILYSKEAVKVNEETLATSKKTEERGKEFVKVGSMSKAELAQLTAQRAQDEYSVVSAQSSLANYKRQLKQLLQITDQEEFDVTAGEPTDAMASAAIPSVTTVYDSALQYRPEIKNAMLGIQSSDVQIKIAKGQRLPTIGLNASIMTNTTSMNSNAWATQLKNNFTVDAYPDDTFEGAVTQVRQEATTTNNVVTYEVVISAPNQDLKLKPGLTANVTIYTQETKGVLSVPSKALRFTPEKDAVGGRKIKDIANAKNKVWTLEGNTLVAHRVTIGATDGTHTQILSGIQRGQKVITGFAATQTADDADGDNASDNTQSPFAPGPRGNKKK